jgi:hypothetical protein
VLMMSVRLADEDVAHDKEGHDGDGDDEKYALGYFPSEDNGDQGQHK